MSRLVKILAILVLAIFAGLLLWRPWAAEPNWELVFTPSRATAVLDDIKTIGEGKFRLAPGAHKLMVSMDGFANKSVSFDVLASGITKVTVILVPNSTKGLQWLKDNPDEALRREGLGGEQFAITVKDRENRLPLIKDLPLIDRLYRVDYGPSQKNPDKSDSIAIYIKYYSEEGKAQALRWLKFKGYEPTSLEIIYQDTVGE